MYVVQVYSSTIIKRKKAYLFYVSQLRTLVNISFRNCEKYFKYHHSQSMTFEINIVHNKYLQTFIYKEHTKNNP